MNATFSYYTKSNLKKKTNKNNLIKRKIKICTGDVNRNQIWDFDI